MDKFLVAFSTTDKEEEAAKIASTLVGEGVAACVNIVPGIRSIYKWKDELFDEKELLMIIKTTIKNKEALKARLKELHHYDVPELVFFNITDGLPQYLKWIEDNTI